MEKGEPVLRADLLGRGFTDDEVRRARRAHRWTPLRPGAYLPEDDPRLNVPDDRHRLLARATVPRLAAGAVVSHVSAAVLHGLPVWGVPLRTVHVTRDARSGGRTSRHVQLHAAPIGPDEIVVIDGLAVTTLARTVVDVARTAPFETAVTIADAALFSRQLTWPEVDEAMVRAGRRRGGPASRRVVAFANGLADGPGESRSRVRMSGLGIPRPVLQHVVRDRDGLFVAQVDFWWPGSGVVGEFDGLIKYGRSLKPGEESAEAVYREKLREDAIRAQNDVRTVIRWTWRDIDTFADVAERLRRVLSPPR
ncbi:hypothetical protein I4I78_12295 [Pseudonocardia sp. KRD-291]|nr:hypothetical protein [Pseudonocardia sp. KRD291]